MLDDERLLTKPFVMLALADLGYFTAVGVAIYALPLYVTGPLGGDEAGAGLAFGAFAVSALLLRPIVGRLCDTVGRLPVMMGGALLAAVGLALTATAETLAAVVALRLLLGVAEAAFFVASLATLADLSPPSRMGEALSYNSLGLYLGIAFGPPFGELLVETWSFTVAWLGAGALAVVAAALVVGIGETMAERDGQVVHELRWIHRKSIGPALGFFASLLAVGGFLSLAALHAHGVGLENASIPLFVYGVLVVVCRVAFAKVPDRLPSLALGAAALGATALGMLVIALWTTPAGMVTGAAVLAVGVTFSTPAFFSAIFATALPSERGAASGTAGLFVDLGLGFGPIVLGVVADGSTIPVAIATGAGCAALGMLWTARLHRATLAPAS